MEVKCPTCGRMAEWTDNPHRPFCSERCQLIDFGAWVDEEFRVPVEGDWPPDDLPAGEGESGDGLHHDDRSAGN